MKLRMTKTQKNSKAITRWVPLKIAVIYAIFSALWILLSDQILYFLVQDPEIITNIQMIKGWFFILTSALIIFFLLRKEIRKYLNTEKALQESEKRLNTILESSPNPVVVYDTEGTPHYLNPSFTNSFGWSLAELKGKRIPFVPEDQKTISASKINELYRFATPVSFLTKRLTKQGSILDVIISAALIKNFDEKPSGMVVSITDITKQMILETQLQQAQKMESVGRLAGGVAHDFNNMLSIVIGRADIILEEVKPGQPFYNDLMEIRKAGSRSADLTRQLLGFARKQTVAPRVIDLNKTVESMLKMLQRLIGEDIDMAWIPVDKLWQVKIDPGQIDQILANLCINARDAITGVGKVTIETGRAVFDEAYCRNHAGFAPGEYAILAVSDNGCGMDTETLSHLFEPFFTTKEQGKGTGLGLATVYGIVKQNDGFINVYSEQGQGTTFKVYLPRHMAKAAPVLEKGPDKPTGRGHETVLLVEDESAILEMTTMMLKRQGYTVMGASTPGEAIRLATEHAGEVHLLMTDVVMPEMNGRDLARNILSLYPGLKCLFMSGYTANVIAHHGVLDEGVNFIQKPFSKSDLAVKVREVLDRK